MAEAVGHKKKLMVAIIVIVILAVVLAALFFVAPDLLQNIGGTFGTTSTAVPNIDITTGSEVAPTSPFENVEEKSNPFDFLNPFSYGNPFG